MARRFCVRFVLVLVGGRRTDCGSSSAGIDVAVRSDEMGLFAVKSADQTESQASSNWLIATVPASSTSSVFLPVTVHCPLHHLTMLLALNGGEHAIQNPASSISVPSQFPREL